MAAIRARRPQPKPASGKAGVPVKVGKKSKTGDPRCSAAMSSWVRARNAGEPTPVGIQATLGRCRSMAHQAKQADSHANAGNDLKAQALRSRVAKAAAGNAAITKAERSAQAKSLAGDRAAKNAARGAKKTAKDKKTGKTVHRLAGAPEGAAAVLKPAKDQPVSAAAARKALAERRSNTAAKLKTYRASELEKKAPHQFGKVGETYSFDVGKVHFDPDRFQYKLAAQGSHGVTDALGDVEKWDSVMAGSISLWRDPANGKTYVVNGHHRLDLAKRLGVGKIKGQLIDAPDAKTARGMGALVNIAEGRGTATDAAKFFRDTGITPEALKSRGVSLREHTATQGLAMAGLSDRAFKRVVDGGLTTNRAAIVGGSGLSHEQQDQLLKVLDKPRNAKLTDGTVRNMTDEARAAGSRSKKTVDLFGSSDAEEALFVHRAKAADKIGRELAADKKLFGLVSKSKAADKLAERGRSTIDREQTGQVSAESAAVLGLFQQLKNRHPGVSRALNQAAEQIADGRPEKEVLNATRAKVSAVLKRILSGEDDPFS